MIGVSPAYYLSKYGEDFTINDVLQEVHILKELGFSAFQLEVTKRTYLKDWTRENLEKLAQECTKEHMQVSQVVAHFWIDNLSSVEGIQKGLDQREVEQFLDMVDQLPHCRQLTVPFGRFKADLDILANTAAYASLLQKLTATLEKLCVLGAQQGTFIALELQPGAIIQGVAGFHHMLSLLNGHPSLAYNLDTGHAHATKDVVELIPVRLGQRIVGTHLCDNATLENLSLTPGEGSIDWSAVCTALKQNHYKGSYDLEIMCKRGEVEEKYSQGLRFISQFV